MKSLSRSLPSFASLFPFAGTRVVGPVLLLIASLTLAGCQDSSSEEYHTYGELTAERADNSETDDDSQGLTAASKTSETVAERDGADSDDGTTLSLDSYVECAGTSLDAETDPEPAVDDPSGNSAEPDNPAVTVAEATDRSTPAIPNQGGTDGRTSRAGVEETAAVDPLAAREAMIRRLSGAAEPAAPRKLKLLVPEKIFKVEGPEKAIRVSYDDFDLLKILNMEPVPPDATEHFPFWLAELDGKRVRVRGFMYPPFKEEGLKGFVLARDNQICCFGRNPKIYDLVKVKMREGETTDYINGRPFDVVGTFAIEHLPKYQQLYSIDDAIVIDR